MNTTNNVYNPSKMSSDELQSEAQSLHESIYTTGCYGVRDIRMYHATLAELSSRGYQSVENINFYRKDE